MAQLENMKSLKTTVGMDFDALVSEIFNDFTPHPSNMVQLEKKSLKDVDLDIDEMISELCNDNSITSNLQDFERVDPREEFPLPNAKRSRIIDTEVKDQIHETSDLLNLKEIENPFNIRHYQNEDKDQTNETSDHLNLKEIENPFNMMHYQNDNLFSQITNFKISDTYPFPLSGFNPVISDPLLNSAFPLNNSEYDPNEYFTNGQYYPSYNNFINDVPPHFSPSWTNQLPPPTPPEAFFNTSNTPKQVPKYPPFNENKSILHELLTAPLKPKAPKDPSDIEYLIYKSINNSSSEDKLPVLPHDKVEVTSNEANMHRTTEDNTVSVVKRSEVIQSSVGNVVMSYLLPTNPSTQFVPTFKAKKREACSICNKTFETKYKLKIHMNSHTGNRPYVCETCGASFLRSSNLGAHRRTHNPKEFKCPLCPKVFAHNSDRVVHIVCQVCITLKNMLEPTGKGWNCKECGEYLDNKSQFEGHLKKHKKNRNCPVCFLDFTNVREHLLVSHVRRYHPNWLEHFGV